MQCTSATSSVVPQSRSVSTPENAEALTPLALRSSSPPTTPSCQSAIWMPLRWHSRHEIGENVTAAAADSDRTGLSQGRAKSSAEHLAFPCFLPQLTQIQPALRPRNGCPPPPPPRPTGTERTAAHNPKPHAFIIRAAAAAARRKFALMSNQRGSQTSRPAASSAS